MYIEPKRKQVYPNAWEKMKPPHSQAQDPGNVIKISKEKQKIPILDNFSLFLLQKFANFDKRERYLGTADPKNL